SAAAWVRECLAHLEVDEGRMRANLALTGGALLAERVVGALAPELGRLAAHDLVARAVASGRPLGEALAPRGLDVAALLDPAGYLGSAPLFVDAALAAHAARRRGA